MSHMWNFFMTDEWFVRTCLGTYDATNPFWSYDYLGQTDRAWNWLL